jgi:uncharacterized membrane protein
MAILIIGLVTFLGMHSVRIVADGARNRFIGAYGTGPWKGLYSAVSALGLGAILWGYASARAAPVVVWTPLADSALASAIFTLLAFILLAAAYVPRNGLKSRLHHPMVLSVMAWSLAHLLVSFTLAHLLLFGGFFAWATLSYLSAVKRDRTAGVSYAPGRWSATITAVVIGTIAWAVFALWVHGAWLGVRPFE